MSNPLPSTSTYFRLYWYLSSSFPQLSFLILSVHFSFKIFLKYLLTNTWSLFMTPCVIFQVSQPYSSTDLTFELKSLIFVEIEILDAFHTLLRYYVLNVLCAATNFINLVAFLFLEIKIQFLSITILKYLQILLLYLSLHALDRYFIL